MSRKVLVAEDDPEVREALAEILREDGYQVQGLPDGDLGPDMQDGMAQEDMPTSWRDLPN